jgi:hypothetical protein
MLPRGSEGCVSLIYMCSALHVKRLHVKRSAQSAYFAGEAGRSSSS